MIKNNIIKLHDKDNNKPLLLNINNIVAIIQHSKNLKITLVYFLDEENNFKNIEVLESVDSIYNNLNKVIPSLLLHMSKNNELLAIPIYRILSMKPTSNIEQVDVDSKNFMSDVMTASRNKKEYTKLSFVNNKIHPIIVNETIQKIYNKL